MSNLSKFALALAVALSVVACSSNNSSSRANGTAVFFHNVQNATTLTLQGTDRGFGEINYELFSSGIVLGEGGYDLNIFRRNDFINRGSALPGSPFRFDVRGNSRRIFALLGTETNLQLRAFELANDRESGSADRSRIFLNVSHANPNLSGPINVYFLNASETANTNLNLNNVAPDTTLNFGETSAEIILTDDDQTIVVRSGTTEIYNSGAIKIADSQNQTILLGVGGSGTALTAYYYNGLVGQILRSNSASTGFLRVVNLLLAEDKVDGADGDQIDDLVSLTTITADAVASSGPKGVPVASSLAYAEGSNYIALPTGDYSVKFGGGLSNTLNARVDNGVYKTYYFFGRTRSGSLVESGSPLEIIDDKRDATLTGFSDTLMEFVHLGYEPVASNRKTINVHLPLEGLGPSSSTVRLSSQTFLARSNLSIVPAKYHLSATNTSNLTNFAAFNTGGNVVDFKSGSIRQFMFIEDQNNPDSDLYRLVEFTQSIPQGAGDVSTVTTNVPSIQVSNSGGNVFNRINITVNAEKVLVNSAGVRTADPSGLTTGGDTVILTTSGNAVISSVTDNNNGTYSATIYSDSQETVTISGTLNNIALPNASVTFTP